MGFFSWKTADTKESIRNIYTGQHRTVYLLQPNGKPPIEEPAYDGYGRFGGIDAYAWLAAQNLDVDSDDTDDELRGLGIDLAFATAKERRQMLNGRKYVPLKFSFDKNVKYEDLPASKSCPKQGYF